MGILVNVQDISKAYGARTLFEKTSYAIAEGEKVGLIGPNGAGKSTMLRILAGRSEPDHGRVAYQRGIRIAYLEQVPLFQENATVMATLMEVSKDPHDWEEMLLAQSLIAKCGLEVFEERDVSSLSGGWKKRVAIARELMRKPDLFLLDEPTNHLDIDGVLWLEDFLADASFATLTITHDRAFLENTSTRILELDRRNPYGILSVEGNYSKYLEVKTELMQNQELREVKLKNTLRREMEWLRRGAKARTTKQQARIQRTGELANTVSELSSRNTNPTVQLNFVSEDKNPKRLIDAEGISKKYNGKTIIPKSDVLVTAKSRIAILGSNGSGKSTLIRMLIDQEQPDTGTIKRAEALTVNYFEQNRESLDPEKTLLKNICPAGDYVDTPMGRIHVRGYLDRFLFRPEQHEMPVRRLSGGEQSRLLLARLMLKKSNLLILDEPTNDLDIATLDVLTDILSDFPGAVLLVSHDRYFLSQVANKFIGFGEDEKGKRMESFATFDQWEEWRSNLQAKQSTAKKAEVSAPTVDAPKKKKLSFKDQREFDQMEATIAKAEADLQKLQNQSMDPSIATDAKKLGQLGLDIVAAEKEVARLYARWSELSS